MVASPMTTNKPRHRRDQPRRPDSARVLVVLCTPVKGQPAIESLRAIPSERFQICSDWMEGMIPRRRLHGLAGDRPVELVETRCWTQNLAVPRAVTAPLNDGRCPPSLDALSTLTATLRFFSADMPAGTVTRVMASLRYGRSTLCSQPS